MSDNEDEYEDNYEYHYSDDDNNNNEDNEDGNDNQYEYCGIKRPLDSIETTTNIIKKKYLDADSCDLRTWADGNVIRMSIIGTIRQIIEHPSNNFRIFCSIEQLDIIDLEWLVTTILCEIETNMTIVYELKFNTLVEMGQCAPGLKCLTYCGLGTYFFPDCLLPNRFSKFVNFGKLFYDLSQQLIPYQSKMLQFYSITPNSICYLIQELAYLTQYNISTLLHVSDSGVVTGIERSSYNKNDINDNDNNSDNKSHYKSDYNQTMKKGVGYSTGCETELKKDNTYINKITLILTQLIELCPQTITPSIPNIFESPLNELLDHIVLESSFEELTKTPSFTYVLLNLIGVVENLYSTIKSSTTTTSTTTISTSSSTTTSPSNSINQNESFLYYFSYNTYLKIYKFKEILESDPIFGFELLQIPHEIIQSTIQNDNNNTANDNNNNNSNLKSTSTIETVDLSESVIFIESFRSHIYIKSGKDESNNSHIGYSSAAFLRRMRIEFTTLSTSLPPTIKIIVLESNYAYSKFLIVGPDDTPYEGGFFLFDMKLPSDYPSTSPSVTFLTTGGGTVRFNPNLYNNGKVCLSLLGTWQGEKWNPEISNINQVLQSICYLIFVPEPYFNEPGYDGRQGKPEVDRASKQYTDNIRHCTLQNAILDHLSSPDKEFGQIIKQMLRNNWTKMKQTYLKWCNEIDGILEPPNDTTTTIPSTTTTTSSFFSSSSNNNSSKWRHNKSYALHQLIEKIESRI